MEKSINKIINILIAILLAIEPILELNFFYSNLEIFGFQINTLIRLGFFGILTIFVILNYKKLKYKKFFILYLFLCLGYFVLHHMNSYLFKSLIPGNLNYSFFEEAFYFIRLLIPIFLIYYTFNTDIEENKFNFGIISGMLFMTLVIIISNIFKFSIGSYSDERIIGNIFDWFLRNDIGYIGLASRGLFSKAIVCYYLILFLPYLIYLFFSKKSKINILYALLIFLSVLTCIIVGTKSTTLGSILILIISIIMVIFFTFIKKDIKASILKFSYILAIILLSFAILPYSPMYKRNMSDNSIANSKLNSEAASKDLENTISSEDANDLLSVEGQDTIKDKDKVTVNELLDGVTSEYSKEKILVQILEKNYKNYGISLYFIETSYPYKYDPYFWKQFIDSTYLYERSQNRLVEQKMLDRIFEVSNNKYDKLFGITYSRTSKVFNLERDFTYQYYSMGIIGLILLLCPYLLIIVTAIIMMLVRFKKNLNFKNCSILLGIGLIICLAYYSGNTMDFLAITMPLSICCGFLLNNIFNKKTH